MIAGYGQGVRQNQERIAHDPRLFMQMLMHFVFKQGGEVNITLEDMQALEGCEMQVNNLNGIIGWNLKLLGPAMQGTQPQIILAPPQ